MPKKFTGTHHQDYYADWRYLGTFDEEDFYIRFNEETRCLTNLSIVYGDKPSQYISPHFGTFDDTVTYSIPDTSNYKKMFELLIENKYVYRDGDKPFGNTTEGEFIKLAEQEKFKAIIQGGIEDAMDICSRGYALLLKNTSYKDDKVKLKAILEKWADHCWLENGHK